MTQLMWHPKLQEEWGKARLYFWRFGFSPTYDRKSILARLRTVFSEHEVLSYACYETTGQYDLLLRVWLPNSVTQEAFESAVYGCLEQDKMQLCEPFVVSNTILHWVWGGEPNNAELSPGLISKGLSDDDLESINRNALSDDLVNEYESMNLVRRWEPPQGIRVMILIPRPPHPLTMNARTALTDRIKEILSSASILQNVSLYEGGGFCQFLMLATVSADDFTSITHVIDQINAVGIQQFFEVRTFTHIIINPAGNGLPVEDQLPLATRVIEKDAVQAFLSQGEDATFEVKGSMELDLKAFFMTGKKRYEDALINDSLIRTIVGFLNTVGGTLIIGAIEKAKFQHPQEIADAVAKYPEHDDYVVVGVEEEFKSNADDYQLRVTDLIRTRIAPSPTSWLSVKLETFMGRTLCIVTVRRVVSDDWFYLQHKETTEFYVREGNSTAKLHGPQADEHKRAHPR